MEQQLQKTIIDYLRLKKCVVVKFRSVGIKKENGSYIPMPNLEKGVSDLIACMPDGRYLAVEIKQKGNHATPDQQSFIERIKKNNGIALVAFNLEDVMKIIK